MEGPFVGHFWQISNLMLIYVKEDREEKEAFLRIDFFSAGVAAGACDFSFAARCARSASRTVKF
jgi:hypothetical protein